MHKVIIDTDPGIDDAQAIAYANAHPEIDLFGLTTVFGNARVELTTRNALTILEKLNATQVPVAAGASDPLHIERFPAPDFVHGVDGLGNIDAEPPRAKPVDISAAEFIVESANQYPQEITLIAIGPLTNLALALQLDADLPSKLKRVIVMGGTVSAAGNVSPVAEANFLNDPHAADLVCGAGWPLTIIGLDVTMQIRLTDTHLTSLRQHGGPVGEFLWETSRFYVNFYSDVLNHGEPSCAMHDASAVVYAVRPELFDTVSGAARVVESGVAQGQFILDQGRDYFLPFWQNRPTVNAAMHVDDQGVLAEFIGQLT